MKPRVKSDSLKQAATTTGIPIRHLRIIKELYPEGFTNNGKVRLTEVTDWYAKNKELILKKEEDSIETLKKQKLANEVILQELRIAEEKRQTVAITEVEEFMVNFGTQLSAVLKSFMVTELPPRVIGLGQEDVTKICREQFNAMVALFNKNMKEWNRDE